MTTDAKTAMLDCEICMYVLSRHITPKSLVACGIRSIIRGADVVASGDENRQREQAAIERDGGK
mgnify:CR=1 FL=1